MCYINSIGGILRVSFDDDPIRPIHFFSFNLLCQWNRMYVNVYPVFEKIAWKWVYKLWKISSVELEDKFESLLTCVAKINKTKWLF